MYLPGLSENIFCGVIDNLTAKMEQTSRRLQYPLFSKGVSVQHCAEDAFLRDKSENLVKSDKRALESNPLEATMLCLATLV